MHKNIHAKLRKEHGVAITPENTEKS